MTAQMQDLVHWINNLYIARFGFRRPLPLPIELWEIILEYAMYIPFIFDTTCETQNFHLFITDHLLHHSPLKHTKTLSSQKSLRLVCRSWNTFIRRKQRRCVDIHPNVKNWTDQTNTRLHCNLLSQIPPILTTEGAERRANQRVAPTQIISVRLSSYVANIHADYSAFFLRAHDFPALRSLINVGVSSITAPILEGIQRSFGTLTVLMIECPTISGSLVLERLEVLYINTHDAALGTWRLPSLLHMAFGWQVPPAFIPGSADKLQSLIISSQIHPFVFNISFWEKYYSLQFLGVASKTFKILDDPPFDHPLSHVHFVEIVDKSGIYPMDVKNAKEAIARLPNVKILTIPKPSNDLFSPMYPDTWAALLIISEERGLKLVDEDGDRIVYWEPKRNLPLRWWEFALVQIQIVLTTDLVVCWGMGWRSVLPNWIVGNRHWYTVAFCFWAWKRKRILQLIG